jgi:hypothetical protein
MNETPEQRLINDCLRRLTELEARVKTLEDDALSDWDPGESVLSPLSPPYPETQTTTWTPPITPLTFLSHTFYT